MIYYKLFDTEQEAKDYSNQEALSRGCSGTTVYWWNWRTHEDGRSMLESTDQPDDTWDFTPDETWFPKSDLIEEN